MLISFFPLTSLSLCLSVSLSLSLSGADPTSRWPLFLYPYNALAPNDRSSSIPVSRREDERGKRGRTNESLLCTQYPAAEFNFGFRLREARATSAAASSRHEREREKEREKERVLKRRGSEHRGREIPR